MPYDGQIIPIPIGHGGLDYRENQQDIPIQNLIKATNVSVHDGLVENADGLVNQNTQISGSPAIVGGCEYWPDPATQRIVVATSDGELIKYTSDLGTDTSLKTGLGTNKLTTFCEGGQETTSADKHLFVFNGNDAVQVLDNDGVSTGDIAAPPADWTGSNQPVKGVIHNNRLYAIRGHWLYGSDPTNHETMTGGNSVLFNVYPGQGSELTNLVSIWGRLYLFKKPYGIYYLDDTNTDSTYWKVLQLSGKLGCAGPRALDHGKNEVVFLSPDGMLHMLSAVDKYSDAESSDITSILNLKRYVKNKINRGRLDRAVVIYNEEEQLVEVCVPSTSSSVNNRIIRIYVEDLQNPIATIQEYAGGYVESAWNVTDTTSTAARVQYGSSDGYIADPDSDTAQVRGSDVTSHFQTSHTDFSFANQRYAYMNKNFDFIEVNYIATGNYSINCNVYVDNKFKFTKSITLGVSGSVFQLGVSKLGEGILGSVTPQRLRKWISTYGNKLSLDFWASSGEFKITRLAVGLRPMGDDIAND